jgi:hypothetical protein
VRIAAMRLEPQADLKVPVAVRQPPFPRMSQPQRQLKLPLKFSPVQSAEVEAEPMDVSLTQKVTAIARGSTARPQCMVRPSKVRAASLSAETTMAGAGSRLEI